MKSRSTGWIEILSREPFRERGKHINKPSKKQLLIINAALQIWKDGGLLTLLFHLFAPKKRSEAITHKVAA